MVQLFWPPDNTVLSEEANRRCFWLPTQPRETSEAEKEIEHTEGRAAQHTEVSSTCNHSALWFCSPTWEKDWGVCSHHLCLEWMNTFPGLLPFIKTKHNIQMKCFLFGSSGFYKIALQCKRPLSLLLCSLLFKEKGLSPLLPLFVPRTFSLLLPAFLLYVTRGYLTLTLSLNYQHLCYSPMRIYIPSHNFTWENFKYWEYLTILF